MNPTPAAPREAAGTALAAGALQAAGVVLAAGGSRRLGAPKQLLPYDGATLLDAVLAVARACPLRQLICVLGGAGERVRAQVDLHGVQVVDNPCFGSGCGSSISAALAALDPGCQALVLMLGDQPGVTAESVVRLLGALARSPAAVCRYEDGRGHPLAFAATVFDELRSLHGDRGVWRLLGRLGERVAEVPVSGPIPRDVDTWADYRAMLEG
jgi:molybdenum cofactor cytidylyltransferase